MGELWNSKDCAKYLNVSQRQFIERTSKYKTFPKPFRLGGQSFRWSAEDIKEWVENSR